MALDGIQAAGIINKLEIFLDKKRPPEHLRNEIDISYKIEDQSIIIFSIYPNWQDKQKTTEQPIAKTTWVHTQKVWKVYWRRSDLKWHGYEPQLEVRTIDQFLELLEEDQFGCFWG